MNQENHAIDIINCFSGLTGPIPDPTSTEGFCSAVQQAEDHLLWCVCEATENDAKHQAVVQFLGSVTDKINSHFRGTATRCPICQDVLLNQEHTMTTLPCGHSFHRECVSQWLHHRADSNLELSCPVCRILVDDRASSLGPSTPTNENRASRNRSRRSRPNQQRQQQRQRERREAQFNRFVGLIEATLAQDDQLGGRMAQLADTLRLGEAIEGIDAPAIFERLNTLASYETTSNRASLLVCFERGRLYEYCMRASVIAGGTWTGWCESNSLCRFTCDKYVTFYQFVAQYPRLLLTDCSFTEFMYHVRALHSHLNSNESLTARLAQPLRTQRIRLNVSMRGFEPAPVQYGILDDYRSYGAFSLPWQQTIANRAQVRSGSGETTTPTDQQVEEEPEEMLEEELPTQEDVEGEASPATDDTINRELNELGLLSGNDTP